MQEEKKRQLYLQLSRHNEVQAGPVKLADVASLYGLEAGEIERIGALEIQQISQGAFGRYSLSAGELAQKILGKWPQYELVFLGDPEMILEYSQPRKKTGLKDWLWTVFVSVVIFVGSAFTIMTFIRESNLDGLFGHIYVHLGMHGATDTHGIEICFAVGVGLGMLLYFNHFGHFRLQGEPTPMEMEMHQYMEDAEETVLEAKADKEEKQ